VPDVSDCALNPIGFLGADWWGSDARAMGAELRRRGCLLIERHYEDHYPTRWRSLWLRALRRVCRPLMAEDYNAAVLELLQVRPLEFLLVFKGMLVTPQTLKRFRDRSVPIYCVYPDVSFQDHGSNIWDCLPLYDCVFTTKSWHLDDSQLRKRVRRLQHVSHGFDPEVHRPVAVSQHTHRLYACDVSFVGYWSPKKERLLLRLMESMPQLDLRIWGPSWHLADPALRRCWQGRGAWGDEISAIYASSRINLGLLSEAGTGTVSGDLTTARTWQIPASGGFLLHEDTAELRRAFLPDSEVGVFTGPRDVADAVKYWLQQSPQRMAAARAAHARAVRAPYTYAPAVDQILACHQQWNSG
jgi:spore maturation protein CgeB